MGDVEAREGEGSHAITKTVLQTSRDTLLFTLSAGLAFGPFWVGVDKLVAMIDSDGEGIFALRAAVSVMTCAVAHEFFFDIRRAWRYVLADELSTRRCREPAFSSVP